MDEPMASHWNREVLNQVREERMALCYKPLLLLGMCDHCDTEGRASIRTLAQYFSGVFQNRRNNRKVEENPSRFPAGNLPSDRSLSQWEYEGRQEPLRRISKDLLVAVAFAFALIRVIHVNPRSLFRLTFLRALRAAVVKDRSGQLLPFVT